MTDPKTLALSCAEIMTECPLDVALRRMEVRLKKALAEEREACAKVCESFAKKRYAKLDKTALDDIGIGLAGEAQAYITARDAIRLLGEK
jgi:hypothetical protein